MMRATVLLTDGVMEVGRFSTPFLALRSNIKGDVAWIVEGDVSPTRAETADLFWTERMADGSMEAFDATDEGVLVEFQMGVNP